MSTITGLPVQLKDKNGDVIFPFTNNFPKDTVPTSASVNILDSGAIYDALQFKSDTDHTHQISSIINLESSLTGKADLEHTHTFINNTLSINGNLAASGITNNFITDLDLTTPLSTFVSVGSTVNYNIYRSYDSKNNAIFIISKDLRRGTGGTDEDYSTALYFYGPRTGAKNLPSGNAVLEMNWKTNYSSPYLSLSCPTQGLDEELTRVDYVKSKVKSGIPDREHGIGFTSNWPASGWTNTLGDGWIHVYLPVNKTSYIIQDDSTICLGQYTINSAASDANGVNYTLSHWIPVLSGKVYKIVNSINGTSRAVDGAVWCPIKF